MEPNSVFVPRPITNNPYKDFPVDVILPYKDNTLGVANVLESLHANKSTDKKVYLVDDNSENKQFIKQYEKIPWIKSIRFEEDRGFGYCVNHAVKQGSASVCVVLHSDIHAIPVNFIKEMVAALVEGKKDNVALVGAYVDNPMPKSCDYLKKPEVVNPDAYYSVLQYDQWMPFMAVAFSKSAFGKCGGLATYPYCWFEDKLLNDKLRAFGYNIALANRVFVRHTGGVTVTALCNKKKKIIEILKQNKKLYEQESLILQNFLDKKKKT